MNAGTEPQSDLWHVAKWKYLTIGKHRLQFDRYGKAWISHEDGESMETTVAKLEVMLDDFWAREF